MRTLFSSEDRRKTIGIPELAQLTGWPPTRIYEYVRKRTLPAFRHGKGRGSRWSFHRDELEIWWANIHQG
jgi:predicted DNA-binding transcriptional regulator AlpA